MRYFVVLQPRLVHAFGTDRSLWIDLTLSRDRYEPRGTSDPDVRRDIEEQAIEYGEWVANYEHVLTDGNRWRAAAGGSWLRQGGPDLSQWRRLAERDRYLGAAYHVRFNETDWSEFSAELRARDFTYTLESPGYEEDGTVRTVGTRYEATFGAFRAGGRVNLARFSTTGLYQRKEALDTRLHLARTLGPVRADLSWNRLAERFTERNPDFNNVQLMQTLRTWILDLTWQITTSLSLTSQLRNDHRSANVVFADYQNSALSLALVHVY